jgi:hypothetical protein
MNEEEEIIRKEERGVEKRDRERVLEKERDIF